MNQKRSAKIEAARQADLANSGVYDHISWPDEKKEGTEMMGNSVKIEGPGVGKK